MCCYCTSTRIARWHWKELKRGEMGRLREEKNEREHIRYVLVSVFCSSFRPSAGQDLSEAEEPRQRCRGEGRFSIRMVAAECVALANRQSDAEVMLAGKAPPRFFGGASLPQNDKRKTST